ncbi:enoyl-CoA hydratase-related protein [Brevibacterium casei]|uniref:enoyl-CoA hydratase/isomerase family protein n=1 Tax=Brevibacterium TaxID=1696 RepID=UPI0013C307AF|nr:enoyl-CoA hydratase-related protein [Brevibacterium casei]MBE4694479.1 enoyl-CoA hydratase/isomerase family protein [Brevibacterium casei]MBY3577601.1 enoyl-CoA hydratase/isomerase family protein [Brevibacterium casei]MCT1446836.1 enoyl-CoA hydratase-related protein [Brevibacterium casei]MCT2182455.1 enoyl-CoA hydratase-related protein [Brevibacterium casei]
MVTEIRLATRGPIAEIVLDGPESRNALDAGSLRALAEAVSTVAEAVPDVRVLLIRGEGKVFCSGRDISAVDVETDDAHAFLAEVFTPIVQAIRGLSIPVVAQVQGAALGLGFGLAAAADIIYAAEDAKFGSPFAAIGAVLDSGAHHVFLDRVGYHRTMDLIVTGDFMSGAEAAATGIVSRAVPAAELEDFVAAKLARIVTGPAEAYAMEKGFVQRLADERPSFAEVLDAEAHLQETARRTPDYAEGFRAFQERRKPNFG